MKIICRKSTEESFRIYKSWFADKALNKQLGPMENETWETWQTYFNSDEKSEELAAYLNNELVAVVDISLPTKEDPEYYITAIATNPKMKRLGIGTAVLKQLIESGDFTNSKIWRCHISHKNVASISFFKKFGWKKITEVDEHGMITYEFISGL